MFVASAGDGVAGLVLCVSVSKPVYREVKDGFLAHTLWACRTLRWPQWKEGWSSHTEF